MSVHGGMVEAIRQALAPYGMELVVSEDVERTLELRRTLEIELGNHLLCLVQKAELSKDVFYDYNCTFKITSKDVEVAVEGLKETHK